MCTEAGTTRRAALFGGAGVAAAAMIGTGPAHAGGHGILDLTYPLTTRMPGYTPGEEARRRTVASIGKDGYYMQEWRVIEHIGTHVDAPAHFTRGGRVATELRPDELLLPAAVVDIAGRAAHDPDTMVMIEDLRAYERRHGRIPDGAAVLMYSGWGARTGAAYRNDLRFPGFGTDACEWLLTNRRIRSLGVDTLSIDPGVSTSFDTHVALTGADRYGVENLANLERLPRAGARIFVGLVPYEAGSGGPARVLATW
ncbi:cyclase family protein [Actinoplanes couchii]|uniref:Cyclase n=1 Tax=Actinoplanes couchii TaxID=403638 RepID=A0ABQ3XG81_9ACTN|nr:cyclase family protein [Actinoplanes couchii]MDR6320993.1 kynurenine formamidase [Actinoplanes couchii]GID57504.1 cyclase [Actinoplanes couchii]